MQVVKWNYENMKKKKITETRKERTKNCMRTKKIVYHWLAKIFDLIKIDELKAENNIIFILNFKECSLKRLLP